MIRFRLLFLLSLLLRQTLGIPVDNGLVLKQISAPARTVRICEDAGAGDFILVIDGSTSIGDENFRRLANWLANTAARLPDTVRYAVMEFSGHPVKLWGFDAYDTRDAVVDAFRNMRYITGTTKIGKALEFAIKELINQPSNRKDVPDTLVLITDGRSSDDPTKPAERIRAMGISVIALGITNLVDDNQLLAVAGDEANVVKIDRFEALDDGVTDSLVNKRTVCRIETVSEPVGEPTIDLECRPDSIYVGSETRNAFEGSVFVKEHAHEDGCRKQGDGRTKMAEIEMAIDECATTRRRSVNPPGVYIENTVVFSFHNKFITKVDRVFEVRCFYMEADKTVSSDIAVSQLTTGARTELFPMPTCEYTLHREGPDGPEIRFALVGEKVFHKWECDDSQSEQLFKMKVHNCYVEDPSGDRIELLDANGCSIDKHLLSNLNYEEGRLRAHVEAHAFKYPDESNEKFNCQIELCVDLEDGCADIPPVCDAAPARRRSRNRNSRARRRRPRSSDFSLVYRNTTATPSDEQSEFSNIRAQIDVFTKNLAIADPSDFGLSDFSDDVSFGDVLRAQYPDKCGGTQELSMIVYYALAVLTFVFTLSLLALVVVLIRCYRSRY